MSVSLFRKAISGGLWMVGINYVSFVISLVGQIILVRILVPEDFGIFALALSISEIIFLLSNFCIDMPCIVLQDEPDVFDTGMYLSLFLVIIMAILTLVAGVIAHLFYNREIVIFLIILCIVKMVQLPTMIYSASMEKDLLFKRNAAISGIVRSFALIVALGLAYVGFGAWSLLAREVLMAVFLLLGMIFFSNYKFLYRFNRKVAVKIWNYSYRMLFLRMGEVVYYRLPIFIIGNISGLSILGLFDRSFYLARLPNTMLVPFTSNVSFSIYSRIKDNYEKMSEGIYWSLLFVIRIALPIGLLTFLFPETILRTLFGMNWVEAAPFLKGFSLFLVFIPLFEILKHLLLANGLISQTTIAYIISIVVLFVGVLVSYILDKWFLISWFMGIGFVISVIWLSWNVRKVGVDIDWIKIVRVPVILSIGVWCLALYLKSNNINQLFSIIIVLLAWSFLLVVFEHKIIYAFYERIKR